MDEIVAAVNQYGFPIIAAFGLGYFIYYIWTWVTEEVDPIVGESHTTLIHLIDRIRMLDNDLIRLKTKLDMILREQELKNEKDIIDIRSTSKTVPSHSHANSWMDASLLSWGNLTHLARCETLAAALTRASPKIAYRSAWRLIKKWAADYLAQMLGTRLSATFYWLIPAAVLTKDSTRVAIPKLMLASVTVLKPAEAINGPLQPLVRT